MSKPIGTKNKAKAEFDARFDRACAKRVIKGRDGLAVKFNLLDMLIDVAAGLDESEKWSKVDRLSAARALLDKRYANKRELSGEIGGAALPGEIRITYDDSQRDKPVLATVPTVGTTR